MNELSDDALTPERQTELFRNAVLRRLGDLADVELVNQAEMNYLWLIDGQIRAAVDAIVETVERVAPHDE